jgi:hypothetical protein
MFFQIGIQCFSVGVDVGMDMGVGVGLGMGVGVGLGMDVVLGVGVGMGVGMLLLLLLLLHCCCCCCTCAAAKKLYNTTYLGLGGCSAAVEYVACAEIFFGIFSCVLRISHVIIQNSASTRRPLNR